MTKRALILSGGGLFGISWETSVAIGLGEAGVDLRQADLFIGTSAGASVAIQLNAGLSFSELFQIQIDSAQQEVNIPAPHTLQEMMAETVRLRATTSDYTEIMRLIGHYAIETSTVPEEARIEVMTSRLALHGVKDWPAANVGITAVDANSGERVVFNRTSGISLEKAIAASSALPGIWPPVTFGGSRYIDGGVYSLENADLATGYDRVLVLQPVPSFFPETNMATQQAQLEREGSRVKVITPADAVMSAFREHGGNALDPAVRTIVAHLGRAQGLAEAAKLAEFWD